MLGKCRAKLARLGNEIGWWTLATGLFVVVAIGGFIVSMMINYVPLFLVAYPIGLVGAVFCNAMMIITKSKRHKGAETNEGK